MTLDLRTSLGVLVALAACSSAAVNPSGLASPDVDSARVFARGIVSSGDAVTPTFTRDGRTLYFVKTGRARAHTRLMASRLDHGAWTAPEPAPFGDAGATEASPFVAPDGAVYFASTRARAPGDTRTDLDLWVARPTAHGFAAPEHLAAPIESAAIEVGPSVTRDGTLYFLSGRVEPPGIYRAARRGDGYAEPERLPEAINRPDGVASLPWIAPDESYLLYYFQTIGPADIGKSDLYVSWHRGDGWSAPQPLGPEVNTAEYNEFGAAISPDGRTLYFSRNEIRRHEPTLDIAWEDILSIAVARVPALRPDRDD